MGVDDFIARLEMALAAYGFTGDNAIGELQMLLPISRKPTTSSRGAGWGSRGSQTVAQGQS
jgi:hypothetical protein